MNQKQFQAWIDETQSTTSSDALHDRIDALSHKNRTVQVLKFATFGIIILFLVFSLLINLSQSFYIYALDSPLKEIAQAVRILDKNYERALEVDKYQTINQTIMIENQEFFIESMIVDGNAVIFKSTPTTESGLLELEISIEKHDSSTLAPVYTYGSYYNEEGLTLFNFDQNFEDHDVIVLSHKDKGELFRVEVDASKAVTPEMISIYHTLFFDDASVIIDTLTFGGIKSSVTVKPNPPEGMAYNAMKMRLITQSGDIIESNTLTYYDITNTLTFNFDTGSLIDTGIQNIEIYYIGWIQSDHSTITYDTKLDTFSFLPEGIEYLGKKIEGSDIHLEFKDTLNEYEVDNPLLSEDSFTQHFGSSDNQYTVVLNQDYFETHDFIEFHSNVSDIYSMKTHIIPVK